MDYTYDSIKKLYLDNKYEFYTRPFEINILGIRTGYYASNLFDDTCIITYNDGRDNKILVYNNFTTDPGYYFLKVSFMNPKGCAFVKTGHYPKMFTKGLHGTKQYPALVQYKPVTVFRDSNKDENLDKLIQETGMFNIDFHHGYNSYLVYNNSAGCQVLKNIEDLNKLLPLFELHERSYGKGINYTLIDKQ